MTLIDEFKTIGEWQDILSPVKDHIEELSERLEKERLEGHTIYPAQGDVFTALRLTQPRSISAVITGQDPYHGRKNGIPQAMGLAFSVPKNVPTPPSLKNIQKELHASLGIASSDHGDLSRWALEEGVLLINASLSVQEGIPASHSKFGWDKVTRRVLDFVNQQDRAVAFLAWGKHSHKLSDHITSTKHTVIKTSHPSPLGARKSGSDFVAFMGSGCFKKANEFLSENGSSPIDWKN